MKKRAKIIVLKKMEEGVMDLLKIYNTDIKTNKMEELKTYLKMWPNRHYAIKKNAE